MPNQDLQQYIQQSRQQGKSDEQIRQELLGVGWGEEEINESPLTENSQNFNKSPDIRRKFGTITIVAYLALFIMTVGWFSRFLLLPIFLGIFIFLAPEMKKKTAVPSLILGCIAGLIIQVISIFLSQNICNDYGCHRNIGFPINFPFVYFTDYGGGGTSLFVLIVVILNILLAGVIGLILSHIIQKIRTRK